MLTLPESMLKTGLGLHSKGMGLDIALRTATGNHVAQAFRSGLEWGREWAIRVNMRYATLDDCFRWAFTSGKWPVLTPFSNVVRNALLVEPTPTPARAVRVALFEADRRSAETELLAKWCALTARLYRPDEVVPFLQGKVAWGTGATQAVALQSLAAWIRSRVAYRRDIAKWGLPDVWQSPGVTLHQGTGDCEDTSLLLLSAAPLIGLPEGRMAVGTFRGDGHAWVEFPQLGLAVETTTGQLLKLSPVPVPSTYQAWVYLYPDGRCFRRTDPSNGAACQQMRSFS
jgi:transglutaminase-like putative cysteine protease